MVFGSFGLFIGFLLALLSGINTYHGSFVVGVSVYELGLFWIPGKSMFFVGEILFDFLDVAGLVVGVILYFVLVVATLWLFIRFWFLCC